MRAFIAIELPQIIRTALSKLQERLKQSGADVKWVEPRNIHLTLKFLGEIDEGQLGRIAQAMENTTAGKNAFSMRISSLGAFPKISFPRVIWVGITSGDGETKEIAGILEEKIQQLGIPKEKRQFSTHITIGRIRSAKNRETLVSLLNELTGSLVNLTLEFPVAGITLFKSTLSSGGPTYEALKNASLKDA